MDEDDFLEPQIAGDHVTLRLHEEVLEPVRREVERGVVRIHKRVETAPSTINVEAAHEEVQIERVPVNRPVDSAPEPRQEGDTLIIPVVEEVLVVEKRLVVKEEVRVTRRRVTEEVPITDTVRREVIDIDGVDVGTGSSETARVASPGRERP
ncbi:MAG TPA: YsnF/AvaK domain-containing protein [Thermomicrobiales bacterium]|jgi:uncharacterized protein (TIGR02271 family)|nr:YsnF/AvaK domain-containing protein [Thermomicrobiales bacterium]